MRTLTFDLRDVVRALRRDRAYAVTAILTLALTIGATTAVFSIVDGVLLKPLAYRESGRLVAIREIWRELTSRFPTLEVNERHFEHWRANASSFESMARVRLAIRESHGPRRGGADCRRLGQRIALRCPRRDGGDRPDADAE